MLSISTFILLGSACSAIAEFTAGQRSALMALRSVVERQVVNCAPIQPPYTCERSCGPTFRTCVSWPTCYDPAAGQSCCSNGEYCPAGQYCTDNGCCPEGTTLAECNASVSLSVIPPSADTTSVPAAASTSVAAATTSSPSTSSTPVAHISTSSPTSPTASPKSKSTQKSSQTPVVPATPSPTTIATSPASTPSTSVVQAGGAGQAFGVDISHMALGWFGAIFLVLQ